MCVVHCSDIYTNRPGGGCPSRSSSRLRRGRPPGAPTCSWPQCTARHADQKSSHTAHFCWGQVFCVLDFLALKKTEKSKLHEGKQTGGSVVDIYKFILRLLIYPDREGEQMVLTPRFQFVPWSRSLLPRLRVARPGLRSEDPTINSPKPSRTWLEHWKLGMRYFYLFLQF